MDHQTILPFLAGGGSAGALARGRDWRDTPLGPPAGWPGALRTLVGVMLGSAQPMFVTWGPGHTLLYNDGYAAMLGRKHPEAMGRPIFDVWSEIRDGIVPLFERVALGEPVHMDDIAFVMERHGYPEETHFAFSYTPLRDESGAVAGLFCACSETTARVLAERRTAAERDHLWTISLDLLVVIDTAGRFESVSPAVTRILGWSPAELAGRSVFDFILAEDHEPTTRALAQAARGNLPPFENRYRHRDGGHRWISWVAAPSHDRIYATGRDVTEPRAQAETLRQTEAQLRQSQKMEAVGQLTGGIAHDFNNLLTGIIGGLELMGRRIAQGRADEVARYLDAAQGAARRAAALTHRLLAFSRRQTLDPRPTDVERLVAGMAELVGRTVGPGIAVEARATGEPRTALVDPNQLENALLNLCINARDAMPGGGRLEIATAGLRLEADEARALELSPGAYVTLGVTDDGTGMTPEVAARAFDPFFTTKPLGQGTGLGLSMIHGFVRQSGGQVHIRSTPGMGTTVTLYLPRHLGEAEDVRAAPRDVPAPGGAAGTVLVVDDEPTVRLLVGEVLAGLGLTVLEAADGPAALAVLRSAGPIGLLVTDVGLPGGLNGRQVADAGRALRPGLPVLFITGYAEATALGSGRLGSGLAVLTKPFSVEVLAERAQALLAGEWRADVPPGA